MVKTWYIKCNRKGCKEFANTEIKGVTPVYCEWCALVLREELPFLEKVNPLEEIK